MRTQGAAGVTAIRARLNGARYIFLSHWPRGTVGNRYNIASVGFKKNALNIIFFALLWRLCGMYTYLCLLEKQPMLSNHSNTKSHRALQCQTDV